MASKNSSPRPHEPSQLASRLLSISLHVAGIISCSLCFKYLVDHPTAINEAHGWHWQYLTVIGLTISLGVFGFGLLANITNSLTIFFLKNKLSLCSTPLEMLISILYWGLCAIDPTLVVPLDIYVNPLADFGLHALPFILLSIDLLYFSPPPNKNIFRDIGISTFIAVSYWLWVEHCFSHNGLWVGHVFSWQ